VARDVIVAEIIGDGGPAVHYGEVVFLLDMGAVQPAVEALLDESSSVPLYCCYPEQAKGAMGPTTNAPGATMRRSCA
jgi:hypothetical protein